MKMLVIADDFTGANDTGVQMAKKGARTEVLLHGKVAANSKADVVIINTESRACDAQTAAARVAEAINNQAVAVPLVYKKIDSTFRGNVGAEIAAAMKATGARTAIIAAAIPAAGRVTVDGCCLVNQVPVHETEFASDPKTPVTSSHIATILARQCDLPVAELPLAEVRSASLGQTLARLTASGDTLVVADAVTDADLTAIAAAAAGLTCRYLLVGAAGLANALPPSLYLTSRSHLPLLAVAGSMSEATRQQIASAAREEQLAILDVDVTALPGEEASREIDQLAAKAADILQRRQHCVIRTCRDEQDRLRIDALCQRWHLSRAELGDVISQRIAELTLAILNRARIGGLFLTGGDIAIAVARILNAQGYRIEGEIAPCVPWGTLTQSDIDDLPVITKAGGFGDEDTLRKAIWFTEELYREEK
ncbi:four-carbon acid sugar kinase family protein [Erwinia sp. P6884]|uniref:D-threonate kinase n=1 Tax=Erwinia sp. P6884 TaxID=3141450 RepID=UPI00319919E3